MPSLTSPAMSVDPACSSPPRPLAAAALGALAAAPPASAQTTVSYVALGDSYSSGVGAGSYISSSGSCDRSTNAYSQLWANANAPASYVVVACSGATTSSVISSQLSRAEQRRPRWCRSPSAATTWASPRPWRPACWNSTSSCVSAVDNSDEARSPAQLPGELNSVLGDDPRRRARARVVVLDYPRAV